MEHIGLNALNATWSCSIYPLASTSLPFSRSTMWVHVTTATSGIPTLKITTWTNSWAALPHRCGGDIHSAAHLWILAGSLATTFPAIKAGSNESAMRFQIVSDASSNVLDLSSVSALVAGMRTSRLRCFAPQRRGMIVMQCLLPEVVKKSEAPQHAREPASKKTTALFSSS